MTADTPLTTAGPRLPFLPSFPLPAPATLSFGTLGGPSETAGPGLGNNAAYLAAAIALVFGLSRRLRLAVDARAPNPFLSLLERPG